MSYKFFIYLMIILMFCTGNVYANGVGKGPNFSNSSVRGCYGFVFQGTLIENTVGVPIVAVGRLCGDGRGNVSELTRTLHLPGDILQQTATGTYNVNSDGTGQAIFDVKTGGVDSSQETFTFTIVNRRATLQFNSGTFKGPGGIDIGIDVLVSGKAEKQ